MGTELSRVEAPSGGRVRWLRFVYIGLLLSVAAVLLFLQLPRWLCYEDELVPADTIVILDGDIERFRFTVGHKLMERGYAKHMIVFENPDDAKFTLVREFDQGGSNERVSRLDKTFVSTREEAIEAGRVLKQEGWKRVIVVTSSFHTRRVKWVYTHELGKEGIEVRVYPAPFAGFDESTWWRNRHGRVIVLYESAKLFATYLHLDPLISVELRSRLKTWVLRAIP